MPALSGRGRRVSIFRRGLDMGCDHLREIAALKDRIEDLEAELEELKTTFNRDAENIWRSFDVTIYQARALALMSSGRIITRASLARVCLKGDGDDERNVDWQIKRIRMRNTGLTIKTVYGAGYCLEGESLARVRAAMKGTEHHENIKGRIRPHKAVGGLQADFLSG